MLAIAIAILVAPAPALALATLQNHAAGRATSNPTMTPTPPLALHRVADAMMRA